MTYCCECGELLEIIGRLPWQLFLQCKNKHKFVVNGGDGMGGSIDTYNKIDVFPKNMEVQNE